MLRGEVCCGRRGLAGARLTQHQLGLWVKCSPWASGSAADSASARAVGEVLNVGERERG